MDMTTTTTTTPTTTTTTISNLTIIPPPTKSPEAESETPPRIQTQPTTKPISFTNGVLKRHAPPSACVPTVTYKECLKNHAATLGGHALDGCGEFMPAPTATSSDPTSLKCAACGCHRNFHRRDPDDMAAVAVSPVIEYHPHHRHHPLPPPPLLGARSPGSTSPPPISSSYYPGSAPHMLLALSTGGAACNNNNNNNSNNNKSNHHHNNHHNYHNINNSNNNNIMISSPTSANPSSRKRFRTKFSQDQKEKMYEFAEKVGWKMQKSNEEMVNGFCGEIGVERGVFKVWMHNNKNTFAKRSANSAPNDDGQEIDQHDGNGNGNGNNEENGNGNNSHSSSINNNNNHHHQRLFGSNDHESNAPTNGSSSSS